MLSLALVRELMPAAFAIAVLGAIESLLSAVVADGMTGRKHDPDVELIAQGAGNLVAPFFGGIAATGAIARTVVMAALLFMRRMAEVSGVRLVGEGHPDLPASLPRGVVLYDIAGPLFFGAAQKAFTALREVEPRHLSVVILDMEDVPAIDATALVHLESLVADLGRDGVQVVMIGVEAQPLRALARAGWRRRRGRARIFRSVERGLDAARALAQGAEAGRPPR